MFIPSIVFEEEDINFLESNDIFMGKYTIKRNDVDYYKINHRKLHKLIDIVYDNNLFGNKDKTEAEFDLRLLVSIFTDIIEGSVPKDSIRLNIIGYYQINRNNAKFLMSII